MKVAELEGALLDYWAARAMGYRAESLRLYPAASARNPRKKPLFKMQVGGGEWGKMQPLEQGANILGVMDLLQADLFFDSNCWRGCVRKVWNLTAKRVVDLKTPVNGFGASPKEALCRALVSATFGDEVPDEVVV